MRIEIATNDGERPLSGSVTAEGSAPLAFTGWLALLRALEQATSSSELSPDHLSRELTPRGDRELGEHVR